MKTKTATKPGAAKPSRQSESRRYAVPYSVGIWDELTKQTEEMLDLLSEQLARGDCFYDGRYYGLGGLKYEIAERVQKTIGELKNRIEANIATLTSHEKAAQLRIDRIQVAVFHR
jgi:hypothetical protein